MNLAEFLHNKPGNSPTQGEPGKETGWLIVGELKITDGKACFVDTGYFGDKEETTVVKLRKDTYQVEVKVIEFGDDRRVSRLRIASKKVKARLGAKLDVACTDTANITVSDWATAAKATYEQKKKLIEPLGTNLAGLVTIGNGACFVSSGFGDGQFPIFALLNGPETIGCEVEFLATDTPYPFKVEHVDKEQQADETFHWSKIESIWDETWEELKKGNEEGRAYFKTISPGRRALVAIDIFNKALLHLGGIQSFFSTAYGAAVAEQVLAGYKLIGAREYAEQFERLFDLAKPVSEAGDFRARRAAWATFRMSAGAQAAYKIEDWILASLKSSDRIEKYIRTYVEAHPEDFDGEEVRGPSSG